MQGVETQIQIVEAHLALHLGYLKLIQGPALAWCLSPAAAGPQPTRGFGFDTRPGVGDVAAAFSDDAADAPATRRVSKTGYLRKRGRMNPAWKTRWCEAWPDEGRLYYFREYNEKRCRGYIDCSRITICEALDDGSFSDCDDFTSRPTAPYAFRVRTPGAKHGEEWMLQAASAAERDAWIQCLRGMMGAAAAPRRPSSGMKAPREEGVCALM